MLRFYWSLLSHAPKAAVTAANWYGTAAFIALILVAIFNKSLATEISSWDGFSPWWALIPLALFFCWGMLAANYEKFQEVEEKHDDALAKVAAIEDRWESRVVLRDRCRKWCDEIDTLLDAWAAKEPVEPASERRDGLMKAIERRQRASTPQELEADRARQARASKRDEVRAEAIAAYIQTHRHDGREIFKEMYELGAIGDLRRQIEKPQNPSDIRHVAAMMRGESDNLIRW